MLVHIEHADYSVSNLVCVDTFQAWIPLVWFQQVHQPFVTPGNRAAAVIAGVNIIVFTTIAFLSHREKLAKKRRSKLPLASEPLERQSPSSEGDEKDLCVGVQALDPKAV